FFSATTGMFMFMAAFMAIFNLLMFIFRVVFVYLNAVLLLAFMVILAPFAVPMALFYLTERYFSKWLHLLMYAILVPVLLFAFLGMFKGIFVNLVYEILDLLGGNNFEVYWKFNMPAFS